jgi:L-alanine-DL-glutamate epimerase-like enolase superfamily enzyme
VDSDRWSLEAEIVELELTHRFVIARETWDIARNVFVHLRYEDGTAGIGEVSPDERWGETPDSVSAELEKADLERLAGPHDLEGMLDVLPAGSARCALDIALHDLAARKVGLSVAELIGAGGRPVPATSVTLSIQSPEEMVERARLYSDHPILKMKVGFDGDVDALAAVRSVFGGQIRIDANEGWDVLTAIERLGQMERFDVELCEQPIHADDHDGLSEVTSSTSIPIYADEDVRTSADVAELAGHVDGVNLKLRKTGGIREMLRAIATARAHGLGVMLGCDLESGVAATAQASIAALVDKADIDGPLLLADDPHPGVAYDRGRVTLPPGPGLGVRSR